MVGGSTLIHHLLFTRVGLERLREIRRTTLVTSSEGQYKLLEEQEEDIKRDFKEYQRLAASREKSLKVLAHCNEVELTMETFYQFTLLLIVVLVSWQLNIRTTDTEDCVKARLFLPAIVFF